MTDTNNQEKKEAGAYLAKLENAKDCGNAPDLHTAAREAAIIAAIEAVEGTDGAPDPFPGVLQAEKRAYLRALAASGLKGRSAAAAGIDRSTPRTRQWAEDPAFQKGLEMAHAMYCELLEDEATRRAVEGTLEPTGWHKGEVGGFVRKYSDVLLIFLMKAAMPDKYRERLELKGSLAHIDLGTLPAPLLARIAAGEHPLAVLASAAGDASLPPGRDVSAAQGGSDSDTEPGA